MTGSRHHDAGRRSLKLEGASVVGYRSTFIGGIRDPILIGQIDEFLTGVRRAVSGIHPELTDGTAQLHFHVYGQDGVMGELEPSRAVPHEIGVLGEVTAPTQDKAKAIATITRVAVLQPQLPGSDGDRRQPRATAQPDGQPDRTGVRVPHLPRDRRRGP